MKIATQMGMGIAAVAVLVAIGAAMFIVSGAYNIGADDHHTKLVLGVIEELRERSIAARADSITVPQLEDPAKITAGAAWYSTLCVGCHLAPGVTKSDLRRGLYPHPPNLAAEDPRDSRRAFWTIKHGIKMSAMPAWGSTLNDVAIWDVVAFIRQMPTMTPETYEQLSSRRQNEASGRQTYALPQFAKPYIRP
jgi:mono/diheme cytochrome c family protein